MEPAYDLNEFIKACGEVGKVKVLISASKTAHSLGIYSDPEILKWIDEGAIHKPEYVNTKPWERNPDKTVEILVDAYSFHDYFNISRYLYIAFMYQEKTGQWLIKSLKLNDSPSPKVFPFKELFKLPK